MDNLKYSELRQSIINAAVYMQSSGMIKGTSGNISVRVQEGILITPSSVPYEELLPESICLVSLNGEVLQGGRPSSEMPLHLAVYRARPDVAAVVHSHSKFSTVMASLCQTLPAVTVPGCEFWPVKSASFQLPGSQELAQSAVEALGEGCAAILQHHGLICVGKSLDKAMKAAEYVEENAEIAYWLRLGGSNASIEEKDILRLKETLASGKAV